MESKSEEQVWKFKLGDKVYKPEGAWWQGVVVGTYSTKYTPRGYCVQMETGAGNGPIQIYPESVLVGISCVHWDVYDNYVFAGIVSADSQDEAILQAIASFRLDHNHFITACRTQHHGSE